MIACAAAYRNIHFLALARFFPSHFYVPEENPGNPIGRRRFMRRAQRGRVRGRLFGGKGEKTE